MNALPLVSRPARALSGKISVPGDKSVSHRALMFGALAVGETRVTGLLEGEDVLATAAALRALGATVERTGEGAWRVLGRGVCGLSEPAEILDMGNSGTAARLLLGILTHHPFTAMMTGDASLRSRPMGRVIKPLERIGARFVGRAGGRLPLAITGADMPLPIDYDMPVASAQVKSAVLLAGLGAPGKTTAIEPQPTRDHSERMLRHFGAQVTVVDLPGGKRAVTVTGEPELTAGNVAVPGDISSAAFPLVAALIAAEGKIEIGGVGVNPLRTGLLDTLNEMGANIRLSNAREEGGEPVADLTVANARLKGVDVPAERAPAMIDEYPILAVAAACAEGTTRMNGLAELRVKESDRLSAMARGLAACGVKIDMGDDWLAVHGTGRAPQGGATVPVSLDHRIAMSFLVLGMAAREAVAVDDGRPIDTSFPGFAQLMNGLGAEIAPARASGAAA